MTLTVKQFAELTGMSEHAIRFYNDQGLLPCRRDRNNRRIFDEQSLNWIAGIKCLRACGMPIDAIKQYTDLCLQGDDTLQARYQIILAQRERAYAKLAEAKEVAAYLDAKVQHYEDVIHHLIPDDTNLVKRASPPLARHD